MSSQPNVAVVLVDPLNDFLHPEGKLHKLVQASLEANGAIGNIQRLVQQARAAKIPIFYATHQQSSEGSMAGFKHMNSALAGIQKNRVFEKGSHGAQIFSGMEPLPSNGDVVVSRHWNSSGFANTDLDYQLRQHNITHLVMAGMVANTCLESTARYARELGYHVTLLDATAGFSVEASNAATTLIWPLIADRVTLVDEWVESDIKPVGKI